MRAAEGERIGGEPSNSMEREPEVGVMIIEYDPKGVCSQHFTIEIEGDTIERVDFVGGCHGNLQAISALLRGMKVNEVIGRLEGIRCRQKATSCPDQLAKALKGALGSEDGAVDEAGAVGE